jgi:hypothetical protein
MEPITPKRGLKMLTHYSMDIDNILCGFLCGIQTHNLILVAANETKIDPKTNLGLTIVLDHQLGTKGDKKTCASMRVYQSLFLFQGNVYTLDGQPLLNHICVPFSRQRNLEKVCNEVNVADTQGTVIEPQFLLREFTPHVKGWFQEWKFHNEIFYDSILDFCNGNKKISLQEILSGIKSSNNDLDSYKTMSRYLGAIILNKKITKKDFFVVLGGLNAKYKQYSLIKSTIKKKGKKIETKFGNFLLFPEDVPPIPLVGIIANELGYIGAIYQEGYNIGISRYPGRKKPNLAILEKHIKEKGWFFHPAGFLAARGTRKARSYSPSKYNTKDLAKLVRLL